MTRLKSLALLGTSFAITAGMMPTGAMAAAPTTIYGAGSSLIAPYARQAEDCYAKPEPLVTKATPPSLTTVTPFNYTGTPALNCSTTHVDNTGNALQYDSTGSGTGINAVFGHDPSQLGDVDPNTAGNQFWPSIQYGFSDTSLDSNDVNLYVNGGNAAGTHVGINIAAPNTAPTAGQFANPNDAYGALIQFPMLIAPVAIVYDPVYKKVRQSDGTIKEYKFNIFNSRADGSGGLQLTRALYCAIFTGQITNWNDANLRKANHNTALRDPSDPVQGFSVPMQIVGRMESSGTTSIFTRHLASVCGGAYADATTTLPGSLISNNAVYDKTQTTSPAAANETLGKFTQASGNDGVAKYVDFSVTPTATAGNTVIQGRIGYAGTDYALPGAVNNPASTAIGGYALNTATLVNKSGVLVAPSASSALVAFGSLLPPQSTSKGQYDGAAAGHRNAPGDWVQPASKTSVLADPVAKNGYPIVGTTNFIGYTCYLGKARSDLVSHFVYWYFNTNATTDNVTGLLARTGLAPLPAAWRTAITQAFSKGLDGQNLNFDYVNSNGGHCDTATHPHLTGG